MPPNLRVCSIPDCDRPSRERGWCSRHYMRWYRTGSTDNPQVKSTLDRLAEKLNLEAPGGCWEWTGSVNTHGYGRMTVNSVEQQTHRLLYQEVVGPIERGLTLDHLCRNRRCSNPDHLEPVTSRENVLRSPIAPSAINARKTHCIRGHEFTPENTYRPPSGHRQCRQCERLRKKKATR